MPETCFLSDDERAALTAAVKDRAERVSTAVQELEDAVVRARLVGLPWEPIAEATGLHRQTLWERYRDAIATAQRKAVADVLGTAP